MRSLERRLRKLEAQMPRAVPCRRLFWIFGRDTDQIERRRAEGVAAGQEQFREAGHIIWRGPEPVPAARWARVTDLTPEEEEDFMAMGRKAMGFPVYERGDPARYDDLHRLMSALRAEIAASATKATAA